MDSSKFLNKFVILSPIYDLKPIMLFLYREKEFYNFGCKVSGEGGGGGVFIGEKKNKRIQLEVEYVMVHCLLTRSCKDITKTIFYFIFDFSFGVQYSYWSSTKFRFEPRSFTLRDKALPNKGDPVPRRTQTLIQFF